MSEWPKTKREAIGRLACTKRNLKNANGFIRKGRLVKLENYYRGWAIRAIRNVKGCPRYMTRVKEHCLELLP